MDKLHYYIVGYLRQGSPHQKHKIGQLLRLINLHHPAAMITKVQTQSKNRHPCHKMNPLVGVAKHVPISMKNHMLWLALFVAQSDDKHYSSVHITLFVSGYFDRTNLLSFSILISLHICHQYPTILNPTSNLGILMLGVACCLS